MTHRPYDIVTFDCYGTLIDWERGIRDAFLTAAAALRIPVDPEAALALYVEIEAEVEAGPYQRYRAVLAETARRIAHRLGWPLPESGAGFLAESMPAWPPFPDTNPALRRLAEAGYRLGILSNVDDDLLAWTRRHLAAFFEVVVTAEQASSYKPASRHFTMARDSGGVDQPQGRDGVRRRETGSRMPHPHRAGRLARSLAAGRRPSPCSGPEPRGDLPALREARSLVGASPCP
jgi:putative hydrolase of the HAD superfamily